MRLWTTWANIVIECCIGVGLWPTGCRWALGSGRRATPKRRRRAPMGRRGDRLPSRLRMSGSG
eukprot:3803136-Pyramimonas_sp.AAC.1